MVSEVCFFKWVYLCTATRRGSVQRTQPFDRKALPLVPPTVGLYKLNQVEP
jgi:hypothetical protein